jgi:hypothetical protein
MWIIRVLVYFIERKVFFCSKIIKIMKKVILMFGALCMLMLSACNTSSESSNQATSSNEAEPAEEAVRNQSFSVVGEWKLLNYTKKDGSNMELKACDSAVVWNFTTEEAEPMSDGTKMMKFVATAPESCKFFDFEAKWTMHEGDVFISTTRIGGIGGVSHAGIFKLKNFSEKKFEVETGGSILVFMRL